MPWFVLYTKSHAEKIVAEKLRAMNVEVFCPLIKQQRKWSDRIKTIEEPLFRSYCFVKLKEHDRELVFSVPGFVRYIFSEGKPAIVRDKEIESIKTMLDEVDHHLIETHPFTQGDSLTITSGAFQDTTGTIMRQNGKIITVFVESMQAVLRVNITSNAVVI